MIFFKNREDAALRLVVLLKKYSKERPLILAIPRGAVPMGEILAKELEGDFDVVLVHKIGAPMNPEFAVGAVSEFGDTYFSEAAKIYQISQNYIEQQKKLEIKRLKEKRKMYTPLRAPIFIENRIVVIIDDGIATGATMFVAAKCVRAQKPKTLVVAAAVASLDATQLLRSVADDVVTVEIPKYFHAISEFYEDFSQVSDDDVKHILERVSA